MTSTVRAVPATARWAIGALPLWAVLARVLAKGLPPGIVLFGVIYGSLCALVAIGIVLVYRANRIINFAQAQLGVLAAVVAIELTVTYGVPYLVALLVGVAGAIVVGAVVSLLPRHFRRSSRLILTVATIALAQALAGVSALVPLVFCNPARNAACLTATSHQSFNTPLHVHFSVYPKIFYGNEVVAVVGAALLVTGLGLFLRYSKYGVAIRAAADNGDRAMLLGIPLPRLDTMVWCLASVLSAMAVLLQVPVQGFVGFQTVTGGGTDLLLKTLAAAVIGRMDSLPRTAIAAIGIGIFEALATWTFANTAVVDATLVVVIVLALLIQKGGYRRVVEADTATWRSVAAVRPIPRQLARLPEVRGGLRVAKLAVVAVALLLPAIITGSQTYLAALVLIYAIVGLSLLILTGWTGQISLGQFGLAGLGGATTAVLFGRHGWPFIAAVGAGIAVGALAALVIGLPALRIQGPFLAVTTLAFGVCASSYLLAPNHLTWFVTSQIQREDGRPTLFGHHVLNKDWQLYYLCLVAFFLVLMAVRSLRQSRTGRALIATRDNEAAAKTVALNTTRMKLTAFLVSGAIAGFAGALFVVHQRGVNNGSFSPDINISLFLMVVIGGLGSTTGVVIGAVYVWSTQYFLHGGWSLVASGFGILLLLLILPEGLGGLLYSLRDRLLRTVALRRGIVVPGVLTRITPPAQPDPGALAVLEELGPTEITPTVGTATSGRGP
ncbi:MAG TPA: ABC transporter permease [Acidimicrobiales bacterium]|nr:ABC transporter permease [Acidimicrobiales bacterium]